MSHLVQVQNRWINLDQVMWIEDDLNGTIKIWFEKSTIQTFPKAQCMALLESLNPPKKEATKVDPSAPKKGPKITGRS